MIMGLLVGICSLAGEVLKFIINVLKSIWDLCRGKFTFMTDMAKRDTEVSNSVKSFFDNKRKSHKINGEL